MLNFRTEAQILLPISVLLFSGCATLPNRMINLEAPAYKEYQTLSKEKRQKTAAQIANKLKHRNTGVQCKALYALGKLPEEGSPHIPKIARLLDDPLFPYKANAADALTKMNAAAVPVLLNSLSNDDALVKIHAARALSRIWRNPSHFTPGREDAELSPNPDVTAALSKLLPLITRPDPEAAKAAGSAIVSIGTAAVKALADFAQTTERVGKLRATYLLGEIGSPAEDAVPALIRSTEDPDLEVRAEAISALIKVGYPLADIRELRQILSGEHGNGRGKLFSALLKRGRESAPFFIELLSSANPRVRYLGAFALGIISPAPREAIPALNSALADKDLSVRTEAAKALIHIVPDETSVRPLVTALKDNDTQLIGQVRLALHKVGAAAIPIIIDTIKENPTRIKSYPYSCPRPGAIEPDVPRKTEYTPEECFEYFQSQKVHFILNELLSKELPAEPAGELSREELTRQLVLPQRGDLNQQLRAARTLIKQTPDTVDEVVPVLIDMLRHTGFRLAAIDLLSQIGPRAAAAIQELTPMLRTDLRTRARAEFAIWKISKGRNPTPVLIESLKAKEQDIQLFALEKLREMGVSPAKFATDLRKSLRSKDSAVQRKALELLADSKTNLISFLPEISKTLSHDDAGMEKAAAKLIARIGRKAKSAVPALIEGLSRNEWYNIEHSADALAGIGTPAIPALRRALQSNSEDIRSKAAIILGKIGVTAKDAIPEIIEAREKATDSHNRSFQEKALQQIDPIAAHDVMVPSWQMKYPYIQKLPL